MNAHPEFVDRLDAYLDGDLSAEDRRRIEAHLEACSACAAELRRIGDLLDRAAALRETPIQPRRDLWPAIRGRMDQAPRSEAEASGSGRGAAAESGSSLRTLVTRIFGTQRPLAWAAAAAVVVIAVFALISGGGRRGEVPDFRPGITDAGPGSGESSGGSQAADGGETGRGADRGSVAGGDGSNGADVDRLAERAAQGREQLDTLLQSRPELMPVESASDFRRNLELLDLAIQDSRAALDADPRNRSVQRSLVAIYQKQLDLLLWATRLIEQA